MVHIGSYVACIAEGAAETAIMDILLDNNLLVFNREQLIDEQVLSCRSASVFERRYLRKGFNGKITIFRILDSRREKFKLSKAYEHKVDVVNIITAPEIEMLVILNEEKFRTFKRSGVKPSEFCKSQLGFHNVKSYKFVSNYFSDPEILVSAIKKYVEVARIPNGEFALRDLLRE